MLGGDRLYEREIAGIFSGVGGLMSIYLGVVYARTELLLSGSLLISNMLAFFMGEKNGQRKAANET